MKQLTHGSLFAGIGGYSVNGSASAFHVEGGGSIPAYPLQVQRCDVRVILMGSQVANRLALRHHYLHRKRAGKVVSYAVLVRGYFEGIICFAWPPVSHPMFGYRPGKIVELARVWFEHNPKNLGSCAVRFALKKLQSDWPCAEAVISWCDRSRFEGTLYKASGFRFVGKSRVRAREASAAKYQGGRAGREVQPDRFTQKDIYLVEFGRRIVAASN